MNPVAAPRFAVRGTKTRLPHYTGSIRHEWRIDMLERFRNSGLPAALVFAAGMSVALAACGSSTGDRALSGAGIGAASGAGLGAATGGSVLGGAVLGGAAGAAVGGLTDQDDIDLGKPIWK